MAANSPATISPEKLQWMERYAPTTPGTALDLGCGDGLYADALANQGWQVEAIDHQPPAGPLRASFR